MQSSQHEKLRYSQCVLLVFNHASAATLDDEDIIFFEAMKSKWSLTAADPTCERLHVLYIALSDFNYDHLRQNPKFDILKKIDPHSHVYILGHHYIAENMLHIANDEENEGRVNFALSTIERLFFECILHADVNIERQRVIAFNDSVTHQKLKITLVLCDSAVGYLEKNDKKIFERHCLNSLAAHFIRNLYNKNPEHYLDCVVTGIIGDVYPIVEEDALDGSVSLHKAYQGRLFTPQGKLFMMENGDILPKFVEPVRGSDQWKFVFSASSHTTSDQLREGKVDIIFTDIKTWEKAVSASIDSQAKKPKGSL